VLDLPVLGGLRSAWVREFGPPHAGLGGDEYPPVAVIWYPGARGEERAGRVEWLGEGPAGDALRPYWPPDATPVRSFNGADGEVTVLLSGLLAAAFGDTPPPGPPGMAKVAGRRSVFGDAPLGTFTQLTGQGAPAVLQLGSSP
jgi:hypothetical protein